VTFELNGVPRTIAILDRSVVVEDKSRPKANPDDPREVGAPIPGKISQVAVTVGHLVKKGDPLFTLEAMKMYTSVTAPLAGLVHRIDVADGDVVDVKDLLLTLR
jgi:pyruvate carboxylase